MASTGSSTRRAAAFDREEQYSPLEAIRMLKEMQTAKFDETVEVHFRLGLNVRHADEQLRGTLLLPNGTGRDVRVAVFAEGDKAREAEEAGADVVGARRPREADPGGLHRLRRRHRDAGQDGRRRPARPHPRAARPDAEPEDGHGHDRRRQGRPRGEGGPARVPHRPRRERPPRDRQEELRRAALLENYAAVIDEIVRAKPAAAKGRYIKRITLSSTMGPGIHVDTTRTRDIVDELEEEAAGRPALVTIEPHRPRQRQLAAGRREAQPRRADGLRSPPREARLRRARFCRGGEGCRKRTRRRSSRS